MGLAPSTIAGARAFRWRLRFDGNQLDALGVCGGDCAADLDGDGLCDDVDDCVGSYDDCGICNGPGAIYDCGCADIPAEDCDCDGNQLDALGVCGGDCSADADGDGLCDDIDDCVGSYDDCGIATDLARSTTVGAMTSPPKTATAMATNSTPSVSAAVTARQMRTVTVYVTMSMTASVATTIAALQWSGCHLRLRVRGIPAGTATATATNSTPSVSAARLRHRCGRRWVCDTDEVPGCTGTADNYNPSATDEDGTCTYTRCMD